MKFVDEVPATKPKVEFVVSAVQFMPDGVELSYMRIPDDVRSGGQVIATHSLSVAYDHPSWKDELTELKDLVTDLARDVFEDFDELPISGEGAGDDDDDDDDDRGMGE